MDPQFTLCLKDKEVLALYEHFSHAYIKDEVLVELARRVQRWVEVRSLNK